MEFLLLDLALAFAALLGYRVLQEVAQRGIAPVRSDADAPRRATSPATMDRPLARSKASSGKVPAPRPGSAAAPLHRLINFW